MKTFFVVFFILFLTTLFSCKNTTEPVRTTQKIVYTSNEKVYIVDADGQNDRAFTDGRYALFSRDGKQVIYLDKDIYSINIDGKSKKNITNDTLNIFDNFKISQDGSQIVYQAYNGQNNEDIFLINIDGSNKKNLSNNIFYDENPDFSPDGNKIIFDSYRDNSHDIYIIDIYGNSLNKLTNEGYNQFPHFSPDGNKIVFQSSQNSLDQISIMNSDGSNLINFSNNTFNEQLPQFSPDGKKILFRSNREGNYNFFLMDIDGSNLVNLTKNLPRSFHLKYSADGKKIVFESGLYASLNIFTMNSDGTGVKRVTDNNRNEQKPDIY